MPARPHLDPAADGRTRLHVERRYDHPIDVVWRAVTEPEHLAAWFPFEVALELRPGGAMSFGPGGDAGTGTVLDVDPPHLFAFSWGDDVLRLELTAAGQSTTTLVLEHTFADRFGGASFTAGWEACLAGLDEHLEGRSAAPTGPEQVAGRHDELVVELGLDVAEVASGDDGRWQVRVERQLTRPTEVVRGELEGLAAGLLDDGHSDHGGRARARLVTGTGQGARLVVEQHELASAEAAEAAGRSWLAVVAELADRLRRAPAT